MSLKIAFRFAMRELRGGLRGFRVFLACLALGVAAIAAVGTVRAGIEAGLEKEGAALLGGDAEVEFTYRFAREDELAWLDTISTQVSETVDFRSMVVVERGENTERGLSQIRAVDSAYPLVGKVTLDPEIPLDAALADHGVVLERILADRLGLVAGDTVKLGTQTFTLRAILERYPDNASGGFGLGPRTIVLTSDLKGTGLLEEGSMFSTNYRLTLPPNPNLEALEKATEDQFRDQGLRWRDSRRGAGGTARFVERIGAFLILMGLSGLAVGGVGVSAAVRAYLSGKTSVIATLKTLGATRNTVFLTYFIQIGILTILGVAIGLALGGTIPLLAAPLIAEALPIPSDFTLQIAPLAEAALYGILAALIFTLWPLARTEQIRPATLFRDAFGTTNRLPALRYLIATALLLAALIGAAVWFSGTVWLTLWTAGGIAGALFILVIAAFFARITAKALAKRTRGWPTMRLALNAIGARGGETTSVVLSLGLGLAVLSAVGQIDGNLRASFSDELPEVAPSYFFVDIQPDQIDGFKARLDGDKDVRKVDSAPMLRGVITQINGENAEDVAGGHWVVRGDRGVTYAAALPEGSDITEGAWWPEDYAGPPLMSFAAEEGAEIGLKLGDTVTVNILGRDITATIASFRNVSWETGGIGFVMTMNPSALQGAPHSWISTVYASPESEAKILRDLATMYPNITAIRIRDVIDQVIEVVNGISAATRYAALATLVTGFLVLIGAALAGERARTYEAAVLKTVGATRTRILWSFALRAALLGLAAGIVALAAGILSGWAVTTFVMEGDYMVIWSNAFLIIGGGVMASLVAGLAFAIKPLAAKPARVLRARD
ncbi:MAG: FtsX-like permease family protein [Loktanella sp.]|jgi:putative ABC transport system permease protein|nr:FtsX-like permease family protein [Loktanella sp.]MDO7684766.1 FtsX-like permease family protein [Loktanella sp.]MDO7724850.1 FtsX-like permease family protein [Loktanella sp.]MDO7728747.1 FtsX-like permease family protein [Loktanella sp.]